jgi:hypothetical protein
MASAEPSGNPGVVGLAGFGITTLLLQFHNVGWCGVGPIVSLAFVFGAFVSYGAFWVALGVIFLLNHHNVYHSSTTDLGWFLVGWTVYTFIMWIPAMRIHGAMAITFTLLLIGFILLDLAHFGYPDLTKVAGYELMLCAASALYMMAHVIYAQVFGRNILPVGKPWLK